jgi:hypothetical protein
MFLGVLNTSAEKGIKFGISFEISGYYSGGFPPAYIQPVA